MTRDPVGPPPLFARREPVRGGRVRYTIWSEECTAKVTIEYDAVFDAASRSFVGYVIAPEFTASMMLEFGMADLVNEQEEK